MIRQEEGVRTHPAKQRWLIDFCAKVSRRSPCMAPADSDTDVRQRHNVVVD